MSNFTSYLHRGALLGVLVGAAGPAALAQTLYNNGATVSLTSGATLYVGGTMQQVAGSSLQNAGLVVLTGDLSSAPASTITNSTAGTFKFTNTQNQQLLAPAGTQIGNLTENAGTTALTVPNDLTVSTLVTTNGLIKTPASATITLPNGGSVTGEASGHYVQGNLKVQRTALTANTDNNFTNSFSLNPGNQNLGAVSVTRTAGLNTPGISYGTPGNPPGGTKKGIDRIWKVEPTTTPTSAVTVTTTWISDNDNGLNLSMMQMWRTANPGGFWTLVSTGTTNATTTRTVTASSNLLNSSTYFTDSNTDNPLPVELVSFEAERYGDDGRLNWITASEKNSAYFDVESSIDGTTFKAIGRVAAKGNSVSRSDYQLLDRNLLRYGAEHVFYRLHLVDIDGVASYSPVRDLVVPVAGFAVQAFPNPYTQSLSLRLQTNLDGPATVTLYDVTGRQVLNTTSAISHGVSQLDLSPNASALSTGVYLLRVTQGGRTSTLRLTHE